MDFSENRVPSRLRSLKFAYVSSGSHDLAGQRTEKGRPAKEASTEG